MIVRAPVAALIVKSAQSWLCPFTAVVRISKVSPVLSVFTVPTLVVFSATEKLDEVEKMGASAKALLSDTTEIHK